jgi:hypothetical protein
MRRLLLCICVLAATPIHGGREQSLMKPDGVYVSVLPVQGKAMTGDNRIDTAFMVDDDTPMRQYVGIERLEQTFDVDLTAVAVLAQSHGGEVQVFVSVINNGRQTFSKGAQGRQVVLHYNAWGTPYFAVFPRR